MYMEERERMKRIAILTFHAACNYGAFLQTYALVSKVSELADTEVIDYVCEAVESTYDPKNILKAKINPLKRYIKYFLRKRSMEANRFQFQQAAKCYLPMQTMRISRENLAEIEPLYDCFVVGSDQVWNTNITKFDSTYFLDFVHDPKKKISFAASIGDAQWTESERKKVEGYLSSFSYISVRESSAQAFLTELTGRKDIVHTVDPVFLHTKEEWQRMAKRPDIDHYVLFFLMGGGSVADAAFHFAARLAKKYGQELILLSDQNRPYYHPEVKHLVGVGPEEFLGYLLNASCVISNSFHATAMSIILEKEFWVETNIKRAGRIIELLSELGLSERALVSGVAAHRDSAIDWTAVRSKIGPLVRDGNKYLERIVNN